jgi:hypothetical protein
MLSDTGYCDGKVSSLLHPSLSVLASGTRGPRGVSIVWLLLIPFRILGVAVHGVLDLVGAIIFLPVRVIRAI